MVYGTDYDAVRPYRTRYTEVTNIPKYVTQCNESKDTMIEYCPNPICEPQDCVFSTQLTGTCPEGCWYYEGQPFQV
jgi:hypothetical protein